MPGIGEKERDYLFKELYILKSNNNVFAEILKSFRIPTNAQSFLPPLPSLGYRISEKEIEVRGSSLPKPHGLKKMPRSCRACV